MKVGLQIMKNMFSPLAQVVLISLELTRAASEADGGIHIKILDLDGSYDFKAIGWEMKTLTISYEEIRDIMKIVKSFQVSNLLIKDVLKQLKMYQKNKGMNFSVHY